MGASCQTWRTLVVLYAVMGAAAVGIRGAEPTPVVKHWYEARLGMTKDEITALFGVPTMTIGPAKIEVDESTKNVDSPVTAAATVGIAAAFFGGFDERWEYGPPHFAGWKPSPEVVDYFSNVDKMTPDERSRKRAALPKQELDWLLGGLFFGHPEAFVVSFDSDGKVSELQPPTRGAYSHFRRVERAQAP